MIKTKLFNELNKLIFLFKNIQAYNAFRLQNEMKKKVERPWEQPASNKQSAGVKMETDTKHNHTHSHNCSDHHHNHSHSPKSSKTEKKENGKF